MSSKYEQQIAAGLQDAYDKRSEHSEFNVETDKWVIFSDQHRGCRDGADDFRLCEKAYNAALGYYFEKGYTLVILGDAEELWECSPKKVMKAYGNTLNLEAQFHALGRYLRFYGNHDSDWQRESVVRKHLHKIFREDLKVHAAMRVHVKAAGMELGEVFMAHGHQGTLESDKFSWFSRIAVRYGWGFIQRTFKIRSTTPAKDFELRQEHNVAMYRWVEKKANTILIAGHTHRPVFASKNKLADLQDALNAVREKIEAAGANVPSELIDQAAEIRAQVESTRVQEFSYPSGEAAIQQARACYFNTGCCSYSDGDVTALEIADGQIKLVRWPDNEEKYKPHTLASADLRAVFDKLVVGAPSPQPVGEITPVPQPAGNIH
jgi:UDP-2,3-diacylglucosamine pyrophosphatase LpxH